MQINIPGETSPFIDINELMKIKGSIKQEVLDTIEEANVIQEISTFLDADK